MTTEDVTVIIPSYNTIEYTKLAYASLRKYYPSVKIVILDDGSSDGSWTWIADKHDTDPNLRRWRNDSGNIMGHTITYDIGINLATTPLVTIFHSDMICGKNYLENLIKHWAPKKVVCATRIEPEGIYGPGKEKILKPFGKEYNEFKQLDFDKFVDEEQLKSKDVTSRGIFAPWLISKEDFLAIGGHDALHFAPYPEEDADLFLRFALAGYELIQSRDSLCWHWISRGHRSWAKNGIGKDDNMFSFYQNRARRNYLRKWNRWMMFDENHHPIVHKTFNLGFVIRDVTSVDFLHFIEPWACMIYVDNYDVAEAYKKREQPTTHLNLGMRIFDHRAIESINNDVLLYFSEKDFMANANENSSVISKLNDILNDGVEDNSEFELGIFKLKTKTVRDISHTMIKV
jgi:GT2 family glycosyltransferase